MTKEKIKKVAIYARVSTEKQEEEKTIESQIEELREICLKEGYEIAKEYIDNGWSGETLARPALDRLRDDASKGLFDAVYIHSPDRLARKFIYQGLVIEELRKKGVEVFFLNKKVSDNPKDQLLLGIQGLIAEYEKAKILERTRRGRLYKARQGRFVGGIAPYGYEYVPKDKDKEGYIKINEREAEVVRLIFDLYLRHQSVRKVIKELTKRGIKPRKGKQWRTSTINRILRNEAYIGRYYYNKTCSVEVNGDERRYRKRVRNGRRLRDRKEWILIEVPKIVDEEKFRLVQEILKRKFKPTAKSDYLLSGLIRCVCGSTFSGERCRDVRFYRCNNRHVKFPFKRECKAKMIKAEKLENAVWNAIKRVVTSPRILTNYIFDLGKRISEREEKVREQIKKLMREKKKIILKKNKLLELYSEGLLADKELLRRKIEDYEREEKKIDNELNHLNSKLKSFKSKQFVLDLNKFCELAKEKIDRLDFQGKKKFLRYLIDQITLDSVKGKAIIIGHIPLGLVSKTAYHCEQCPKFKIEVEV